MNRVLCAKCNEDLQVQPFDVVLRNKCELWCSDCDQKEIMEQFYKEPEPPKWNTWVDEEGMRHYTYEQSFTLYAKPS